MKHSSSQTMKSAMGKAVAVAVLTVALTVPAAVGTPSGWQTVDSNPDNGATVEVHYSEPELLVRSDFVGYLHEGELPPGPGDAVMMVVGWSGGADQVIWETSKEGLADSELVALRRSQGFTHTGWVGDMGSAEVAAAAELLTGLDIAMHVDYRCSTVAYRPWVGSTEVTGRVKQSCYGPDVDEHHLWGRLQSDLSGEWLDVETASKRLLRPGTIRITLSYRCNTNEHRNGWRTEAYGQVRLNDDTYRQFGPMQSAGRWGIL